MIELVQLAYISAAREPFTPKALRELLAASRAKNRSLGVTGMLLHADGSFLQVLEGRASAVDALYATIGRDRRHERVIRVFRNELAVANFADWNMGFAEIEGEMRAQLGFDIVLTQAPASAARARDLVQQFRLGRWRQKVDTGAQARSSASLRP